MYVYSGQPTNTCVVCVVSLWYFLPTCVGKTFNRSEHVTVVYKAQFGPECSIATDHVMLPKAKIYNYSGTHP